MQRFVPAPGPQGSLFSPEQEGFASRRWRVIRGSGAPSASVALLVARLCRNRSGVRPFSPPRRGALRPANCYHTSQSDGVCAPRSGTQTTANLMVFQLINTAAKGDE